jgi:protein-disulfide isomerase
VECTPAHARLSRPFEDTYVSNTGSTRFSRRAVLGSALSISAVAVAAPFAGYPAFAQRAAPAPAFTVDELMKSEESFPDIVIGKPEASVTIVEYASMTCGHCAAFHTTVLPKLKEKYIDTGKAKLIFREFPLDNLAAAVSMLARCVGGEGPPAFISEMFKRQQEWAFAQGNPIPRLFEMSRQTGFTQASFDKCLSDTKLLEQIEAGRKRASEKFGVNATPTFFINGKRLPGVMMPDFEKAIDPLLKA